MNGLIYYKLDVQKNGYPGDITKNCGLRGEEIDGNFYFLRGNDIEEIAFDEKGTLHMKKVNGDVLTATQTESPEYDFTYDPETGVLTIITPNGNEVKLEGFKITTIVYHDHTLDGNGREKTPLKLSNIAKTGTYRPAKKLVDYVEGETLPTENNAKNDRYVTREKISRLGLLYPLEGIKAIKKKLQDTNSEWRIPTKADWDKMLNAIDCTKPEHGSLDSNEFLGEIAGIDLKATEYWGFVNERGKFVKRTEVGPHDKLLSEDRYGFSVLPVGYADSRGMEYVGGFGRWAAFWTDTEEDNHEDMYVKLFDATESRVGQRTWGEDCYLSLRLVKDFNGANLNNAEEIDGLTVNTMHFEGQDLIWTRDNIALSAEQYMGEKSPEWEPYEDKASVIRYFVNDWNGNGWDKHEIYEGESIVLFEGPNGQKHEWILIDGVLVDTSVKLKEEFQEEIERLDKALNQETEERKTADEAIRAEFAAADAELDKKIGFLKDELAKEIERSLQTDEELDEKIEEETANRIDADEKERMLREAADADLQRQINENKVTAENTSVVVRAGYTDENGTYNTTIKVNLPETGMIKVDADGLYFDGNFNFGEDWKINNENKTL